MVGPVSSVNLSYDSKGKSKGVATIVFSRKGDANKAFKEFNNRLIDSCKSFAPFLFIFFFLYFFFSLLFFLILLVFLLSPFNFSFSALRLSSAFGEAARF